MIRINETLEIQEDELSFTASRGGGPGGQHVNKVASRVTLRFDVAASSSLTEDQRQRIGTRLANRMSKGGVLSLSSHATRSQSANRELLVARFVHLLRGALARRKPRRKSRPSAGSRERRLQAKRQRGEIKRGRGRVRSADDS